MSDSFHLADTAVAREEDGGGLWLVTGGRLGAIGDEGGGSQPRNKRARRTMGKKTVLILFHPCRSERKHRIGFL